MRRGAALARKRETEQEASVRYIITGLDPAPFEPLFELDDQALAARGATRMRVDADSGYPCRVSLRDLPAGSEVLLVNHEHLPVDTPYRSRHAIFVGMESGKAARYEDAVPTSLAIRLLSVRSFDVHGDMVDADVVDGGDLEPLIERLLEDPRAAYLHVHNARRGCYAARVDRA